MYTWGLVRFTQIRAGWILKTEFQSTTRGPKSVKIREHSWGRFKKDAVLARLSKEYFRRADSLVSGGRLIREKNAVSKISGFVWTRIDTKKYDSISGLIHRRCAVFSRKKNNFYHVGNLFRIINQILENSLQ